MSPLDQKSLGQLFLNARTFHAWKAAPVSDDLLREVYGLMKWAPTCVNGSPIRILFLKSKEEKEKLIPAIMPKNIEKTRAAPVTAILAEDLRWHKNLPRLMPHGDYYSHFAGNRPLIKRTGFRNSSLQAGYLILAARALGLDCGPMSGFDNAKVDAAFFAGTSWRSNLLCNIGYGDTGSLYPRSPRLSFDESCKIM